MFLSELSWFNVQTKVNKWLKQSLNSLLCRTTHHIWVLLTPQWRAGSWTESRAALGWQRSHSRWTGTSPHADGQCWRDAENASSPSGTGLEAEKEEEIQREGGSQGNGTKEKKIWINFTKISFFFPFFFGTMNICSPSGTLHGVWTTGRE